MGTTLSMGVNELPPVLNTGLHEAHLHLPFCKSFIRTASTGVAQVVMNAGKPWDLRKCRNASSIYQPSQLSLATKQWLPQAALINTLRHSRWVTISGLAFSLGGEGATQDFEGSTDRYPLRAGGDSGPQSWSNRLDLLAKHCLLRYVLSDFATRVSQRMPWPEKKTIQIGIHIRAVRFVVGTLGHLSKSVMPADVRRRNDVDAISRTLNSSGVSAVYVMSQDALITF